MQDKDFDRFFQQAFENMPEPEYNPADWDNLEDRLHDLNAAQPNTAQPAASGASAGAGLGKLGFVASAVLVTAFNIAFYAKPELFKNVIVPAEKTAVAQAQTEAATQPEMAPEVAAVQNTSGISGIEIAESRDITLQQPEAKTALENLPKVIPAVETNTVAAIKPATGRTHRQKAVRNVAGTRNSSNTTWAWPAVAANRPALNSGNNGLSGGQPSATVQPCNPTFKPEIATVLVGQDTLEGSRISLNSCQMLEARIFAKGEISENILLTSDIAKVLPGARFITEPGSNSALLQWQPAPEMARQQPYNFTLWLADGTCAQASPKAYQFAVQVSPAFTAALNGMTRINKGQETTLEVTGAPDGSSFQWVTGSRIVAENETGRLVASPAASTSYRVVVTAPSGCVFTDSVRVDVAPGDLLNTAKAIPNIFTPNYDGLNDYFEVRLPEEGPYSLEVFDRDGIKVFSQQQYDNKWNAPKLVSGTYYYIITTPREGKTYKGWVEIMK